ncbi:MAG: minichromosome maintenance protein MCM [Spirochaetota bacterium]|nr:minichromosome maintenance protein MCM [Spirochaetota bacterium]
MELLIEYYKEYFEKNIYTKEMGDSEIVLEQFIEYIQDLSITDKILLVCLLKILNKNDLLTILDNTIDSTLKSTISRLNKRLDLKVIKIDNLNYYQTTSKGEKKIKLEIFNFINTNKYLLAHKNNSTDNNRDKTIKLMYEFFTEYFKFELRKIMDEDLSFFEIDFEDIASFNSELLEIISENPKECLILLEIVINNIIENKNLKVKIGLKNLPSYFKLNIGSHRVENIGKLYQFEGIIKRKTEINPRLTHLEYLCINTDCTYSTEKLLLPQTGEKKMFLKSCPRCKAPIDLVKECLIDNMFLILEEDYSTSNKTDSTLNKINLMVQGELVTPIKEKNYKPGDKVTVIGFLEKKALISKGGSESINFQTYIDVNNIVASDKNISINLSIEDIKEIKDFSEKPNVLELLSQNFINEIKGYEEIKTTMMLQLVGSNSNQTNQRNDTHILLVGEPGVAKTKLAEYYAKYASKVVYTSGTNTSKAGLTGACIKDEFTGDWAVEAGSLPKANNGLAIIDELDKMGREDSQVMHDALESQIIPIRKAISIDLICKCSVFACANPKYGYFDKNKDIVSQINLVPSLLNRFDLIYILKDKVNHKKDEEIFNHIIDSWNGDNNSQIDEEISIDFLKKYFYYCKIYNKPKISKEAHKRILDFTLQLRKKSEDTNFKFNARQLNGVIRLSIAYSKLLFKKMVDVEAVNFCLEIYTNCLQQLGSDFYVNLNQQIYNTIGKKILDLILEKENITLEEISKYMPETNLKEIERNINLLKQSGEIYEAKKEHYRGLNK